jgi:hypothetical protein
MTDQSIEKKNSYPDTYDVPTRRDTGTGGGFSSDLYDTSNIDYANLDDETLAVLQSLGYDVPL